MRHLLRGDAGSGQSDGRSQRAVAKAEFGGGAAWMVGESQQRQIEPRRPQLQAYEDLCREIGAPPGEVALTWLLANPAVTAPIVGPRTMAQLDSAVAAAGRTLDDETRRRLDTIWPGPGGEAPEAYAW